MNYKYKFTVFTPTFNRAHTLFRVYDSLLKQTFKNFEWLVVDDGSIDNTEVLIKKWINESEINIRYYKQANKHKFITTLNAVELAHGEFFYTIDSDDKLEYNALQVLNDSWYSIPKSDRGSFSAVTGRCKDQFGNIVGDSFPENPFDSDSLESTIKYNIKGEKSGFQKTDVMKKLLFLKSKYIGKGFIPEGVLWISIANFGFKTRYINDILRIYFIDENDSISINKVINKNSFGVHEYTTLFLNSYKRYYLYKPIYVIGQVRNYISSGLLQNFTVINLFNKLKFPIIKLLFLIVLPLGIIHYKNNINE